jgi:hypothetical protein
MKIRQTPEQWAKSAMDKHGAKAAFELAEKLSKQMSVIGENFFTIAFGWIKNRMPVE